jgi:hypothetical protein
MIYRKSIVLAAVLMFVLLCCGISAAVLEETDLPGSDIASIVLNIADDPIICEQRCAENSSCQAWTYVKSGVWGDEPYCLLKGSVPEAVADECCTSGMKETTPASDQSQAPMELRFPIKYIEVRNMAKNSADPDLVAYIICENEERTQKATLEFYRDDSTFRDGSLRISDSSIESNQTISIHYPYSRFPEILNMLQGVGTAEAGTPIAYYVESTSGAITAGITLHLTRQSLP